MKILLFGGSGFLGAALRDIYLLEKKVQLICHYRHDFSLEDLSAIQFFLEKHSPDIVINLSAVINFQDECNLSSLLAVNVLAPSIMSQWCALEGRLFFHASTILIHGKNVQIASPNTEINIDSSYGHSKYLAEKMILDSGARSQIVRFSGIWGKDGPTHLGINKALQDVINGKTLKFEGGVYLRNYIHVKCAAFIIKKIVESRDVGIYYAASPRAISISEMLKAISHKFKSPAPIELPSHKKGYNQIVEVSENLKSEILDFYQAIESYF